MSTAASCYDVVKYHPSSLSALLSLLLKGVCMLPFSHDMQPYQCIAAKAPGYRLYWYIGDVIDTCLDP